MVKTPSRRRCPARLVHATATDLNSLRTKTPQGKLEEAVSIACETVLAVFFVR